MRAVDTNVLVRLVSRDDAKQVRVAEEFVSGGAWVSKIVLVETAWVLQSAYELDHASLALAIDMLLRHQSLVVEDSDVVAAALALYRSRPTLGFSDCLVLEVARRAGHLPLGTFDRQLGRTDGAVKL